MTRSRKLSTKDMSTLAGGAARGGPTLASQGRAPGSAGSAAAQRPSAQGSAAKKPRR